LRLSPGSSTVGSGRPAEVVAGGDVEQHEREERDGGCHVNEIDHVWLEALNDEKPTGLGAKGAQTARELRTKVS
jgi:hypothetical protein